LAPNIDECDGAITTKQNKRRGKLCIIPPLNNRAKQRIQTLREGSFSVVAPRLFNKLPRELREYEGSFIDFKKVLDKFLRKIPDKPSLPHYYQVAESNSLLHQISTKF